MRVPHKKAPLLTPRSLADFWGRTRFFDFPVTPTQVLAVWDFLPFLADGISGGCEAKLSAIP